MNMPPILENFAKTYAASTTDIANNVYKYATLIRHEGMVIGFAMDNRRRIYYTALNLDGAATTPSDVNFWMDNPKELSFSNEIAEVGAGITDQTVLPVFRKNSPIAVPAGTRVLDAERDDFRSTTARFTADAPFQVMSDGQFIYLFRQAIAKTDDSNIIKTDPPTGDEVDAVKDTSGNPVRLVDSTLLVDRFILVKGGVGGSGQQSAPTLQLKREVRFRRSRSKTNPLGTKDSLGAKDMEDKPFFEPTQELSFVGDLTEGRFSVLLLPTQVAGVMRWQIFAYNARSGMIDSYNVERSPDGLFNTRGTQTTTTQGSAETALQFAKLNSHIQLGNTVTLGSSFTQETWIFPTVTVTDSPLEQALFGANHTEPNAPPSVWIVENRKIRAGFGDGTTWHEIVTEQGVLTSNVWNHLAVSFNAEDQTYRIFVNGRLKVEQKLTLTAQQLPANTAIPFIGAAQNSFSGLIDEVRFWSRPRSAPEIQALMNQRLTGQELGLAAYYRMDEGSGSLINDQTANHPAATAQNIAWVPSDAPIGENASINRSSFCFEGRSVVSGLTSLLYNQQETAKTGYDQRDKPVKRNARVMLAVATREQGSDRNQVAVLDFGVSANGKLPQTPDNLKLKFIEAQQDGQSIDVNQQFEDIKNLQASVTSYTQDVVNFNNDIEYINQLTRAIDDALASRIVSALPSSEPAGIEHLEALKRELKALRQAREERDRLRDLPARLNSLLQYSYPEVYEHKNFGGRALALSSLDDGSGTFTYRDFLKPHDFNDLISSIYIPVCYDANPPLSVFELTVYEDANSGGDSCQFSSSTAYVRDDWNDRISFIEVRESKAFYDFRTTAQQQFNDAEAKVAQQENLLRSRKQSLDTLRASKQQERSQKENLLATDRNALANKQTLLMKGSNAPMPLMHIDAAGLSISGGVLRFAWTADTPMLFDSATGNLSLYYRGTDDQFFVAYYQTLTQRARYSLAGKETNESVACLARSTESEMDQLKLTITEASDSTCTVTIETTSDTIPAIVETWRKVPRHPQAFAKVINGLAGDRTYIGSGTLTKVRATETLNMPEGVKRSLPAGAVLVVGNGKVTLQKAVDQGAKTLEVQGITAQDNKELPVFFLEYDYAVNARTTQEGSNLMDGSRLVIAAALQTSDPIREQTSSSAITQSSKWIAAAPGFTMGFDGQNSHAKLDPASADFNTNLKKLSPTSDLTMEAWVRPNRIQDTARVIAYQPLAGSNGVAYTLGLKQRSLFSAMKFNGTDTKVEIPNHPSLNFRGVITLEAWVKPSTKTGMQNIIVHGFDPTSEVFLRIGNGSYQVGTWFNGTNYLVEVPIADTDLGNWVHLAGVYDGTSWNLYRNGEPSEPQPSQFGALPVNAAWSIGGRSGEIDQRLFTGEIDEVRIWKRARVKGDILADKDRQLSGTETDLVGYWRFDQTDSKVVRDRARYQINGELKGTGTATESPIPAYSVFTGVSKQMIEASEVISSGNWTHLAAVYNQSYGIRFDGNPESVLDAGKDLTLDLNRDLTIEVFLQPGDRTQRRGILSRGKLGDAEDPQQYVPYALYISPAGRLVFGFEDVKGKQHFFVTDPISQPDAFHKIAVTRQHQTQTNELKDENNNFLGVDVIAWDNITFYVDGAQIASFQYKGAKAGTPDNAGDNRNSATGGSTGTGFNRGSVTQPEEIGSSKDALLLGCNFQIRPKFEGSINEVKISKDAFTKGEEEPVKQIAKLADLDLSDNDVVSQTSLFTQAKRAYEDGYAIAPFIGVMTEVRIWNLGQTTNLGGDLNGSEKGLVSWWRFEENQGTVAFDSKSSNHAKLKGLTQWTKDPSPNGSRLVLYRNGAIVTTQKMTEGDRNTLQISQSQFTLGMLQNGNQKQQPFQGEMEELRIWKTARTPEQIQDNVFRRLLGDNNQLISNGEELIAYYPFDANKPDLLLDYSPQANTLDAPDAAYVLSTAPIGEDTPQVRSALAGIRTPFNGLIQSQPGVQEYGDLQTDADGNLFGVFKRCYSFINDGKWHLITGFKVGDLVTEWIGQVQFDPQLIGFIEGAPPVPSENLTGTSVELGEFADYNASSSVELAQAQKTTFTYAAEKESGFDFTFDMKLGAAVSAKVDTGVGIITQAVKVEGSTGVHLAFENSLGWLDSASTGTGITTALTSKLQLQGRVENKGEEQFEIGRRYIPDNMGYALVQSQTADVFALRMRHNDALVSFQMRPNPDIPPDKNIISFPLNPQYVKQGTLDGKVGFEADPDYPNALTFNSDTSYYKPIEAYALKSRLQREEEQIRAKFDQYNAGKAGRRENATHFSSGDLAGPGNPVENLPRLAKRNLVNTYVWTADGGLFTETQETLDVIQETNGGSYAFKGMAGFYTDAKLLIGSAGIKLEAEAMFGGHLNLQVTKSQESENSFALNVDIDGVERDIFERVDGRVIIDHTDPLRPKPRRQAGKVDAYRFMSFYLEPQSDHFDLFFDRVVDPIWLEQSSDPNAAALRQAQQSGKKPACWRIMHRVTFVSRVLPRFNDALKRSASPLEQKLLDLNIDSNYELVKRLEPFVLDKLDQPGEFALAVQQTIQTFMPELKPHTPAIIQFLQLYYGVTNLNLAGKDSLALPSGDRAPNQAPSVSAGSDQMLLMEGSSMTTILKGAVYDERTPQEAIFVTWSVREAEPRDATVEIINSNQPYTAATFKQVGRYVLELTADDGLFASSDQVVVVVNQTPRVYAGDTLEVDSGESVALVGELLRDGRGDRDRQLLNFKWTQRSGPGTVTFDNDQALQTQAKFSQSGSYILQLTVTNSSINTPTHSSDLIVMVGARTTQQLQALYTFDEGSGATIRDLASIGAPFHLRAANGDPALVWGNSSLALQQPTQLVCAQVSRLVEAVKRSNAFTMEAWIQPTVANQPGLARILTLSAGATARNFILGQNGDRYYVGLRTTSTDLNASDRALSGGTVQAGTLTHVVCTRDAQGLTRLYLNGQIVVERQIEGDFSNWDSQFSLVLGNELNSSTATRAWLGAFHLVAFYSRALTAQNVLTNYKFGADTNLAPVVSAGMDQVIQLPKGKAGLQLVGKVADDRLATSIPTLGVSWNQMSGPGLVTFSDRNALNTMAKFSEKGVYTLQLTVNDGEQSTSDEVTIRVNKEPVIQGFSDLSVNLPQSLRLPISVDSGLADEEQGQLTATWTQLSGPATVQISDPYLLNPTVTFPRFGNYRLQLTVSNGLLSSSVEVPVEAYQAPEISASVNPRVTLPDMAQLTGAIANLGRETTSNTTITWSQVSGPGQVTFSDAHALNPTATFSVSGSYVLKLTVHNGKLSAEQTVTMLANQAPVVDAGIDQFIQFPAEAELEGIVSDDGYPLNPGRVTVTWTAQPTAGVRFSNANAASTRVSFSTGGIYVLRLTANDGAATSSDEVQISVNEAPRVDAGSDQLIAIPMTVQPDGTVTNGTAVIATLKGIVQDDGLPVPAAVKTTWAKVSGPEGMQFTDASVASTTASFPHKGIYILQLTAEDGKTTAQDQVRISVTPRVIRGLQALYNFDEKTGNVVKDVANIGQPLNLTVTGSNPVRWLGDRGMALDKATLLTSAPNDRLFKALTGSNALTLEAWITPYQVTPIDDPNAPARIITFSGDLENRNFSMGQGKQNFNVRLRTGNTGNGNAGQALEGGTPVQNKLTHLVYTRDPDGTAILYVDGVEVKRRDLSGAFLPGWNSNFVLALGNEIGGNRSWLGEYYLVAIYDRALSKDEVYQNFKVSF